MSQPRKRWKRTFKSFKVGQFYRRSWESGGEIILLVDKLVENSLFGEHIICTIIFSSANPIYYPVGSKYKIYDWEYKKIKLMRFKKKEKK